MSERFIVIPKWDELQHYKNVDRPAWIKLYAKLHHDQRYLDLTGHERAVLFGIWIEYASSGARLRLDARSLSHRLALRVTSANLERLNHAGFIRFRSRPTLEKVYAREEKIREETPKPPLRETEPAELHRVIANGVAAWKVA